MTTAQSTPSSPTLSAQDVLSLDPGAAGGNLANQGMGSSYLSMLPAILQSVYNSGNSGVSSDVAQSAPFQWLMQKGYLSGSPDGSNVTLGWKAAGVGQGGTFNPSAATNVGPQGFGADVGNQNLQIAGNNPFGVNTQGGLDVHNIQSPTQNPSAFGSNAMGPTVNKSNVASNQDVWSKFVLPAMQAAAGFAMPGAVGMVDPGMGLTGLQNGIFNTLGNMATGTTKTAGGLAGIGGSVLGSVLSGAGSGLGAISPYLNAAMQAYKISQNPSNPGSYLGTLGQLAKLGTGS